MSLTALHSPPSHLVSLQPPSSPRTLPFLPRPRFPRRPPWTPPFTPFCSAFQQSFLRRFSELPLDSLPAGEAAAAVDHLLGSLPPRLQQQVVEAQ